ncbi:hypothetical protein DPMN_180756 [Dreissena polymorpha]|uniref:Uncharacterized protein n=1 Tax=Dreissena polymorpha TaxID=45954 RepID=A0A9D4I346_DREPO|nr:hypothetical protein DPMN_180756 [Dreissena polymorpha]
MGQQRVEYCAITPTRNESNSDGDSAHVRRREPVCACAVQPVQSAAPDGGATVRQEGDVDEGS